jgi:hypothetical protein
VGLCIGSLGGLDVLLPDLMWSLGGRDMLGPVILLAHRILGRLRGQVEGSRSE